MNALTVWKVNSLSHLKTLTERFRGTGVICKSLLSGKLEKRGASSGIWVNCLRYSSGYKKHSDGDEVLAKGRAKNPTPEPFSEISRENEVNLPPPHRCRLSCPLPPPEYSILPFPGSTVESYRGSSGDVNKRLTTKSDFQIFQEIGNKSPGDGSDWTKHRSHLKSSSSSSLSDFPPVSHHPNPTTVPKMNALFFLPNHLTLDHRAVDAPTKMHKDEVLVQVSYSGVCGTDLFITEGKISCGDEPLILGQEISGKVYATGSDVREVKKGDNVVVNPHTACCMCRYCSRGLPSSCSNEGVANSIGLTKNGGWAEYVVVKKTQVHKVPRGLGLDQAALIHPLSCVLCAMNKLNITPDMTVLIQGLGLSGCLWASVLHAQGHTNVVVSDGNQKRKRRFEALGLGQTFLDSANVGRVGTDVVVECTGSPKTIEECLKILNPNGQICLFGKPNPTSQIKCAPYDIVKKEIRVLGSAGNAFCFTRAIHVATTMSQRYLDFQKLGVKVFQLEHFKDAFQMQKTGAISKIMFKLHN